MDQAGYPSIADPSSGGGDDSTPSITFYADADDPANVIGTVQVHSKLVTAMTIDFANFETI